MPSEWEDYERGEEIKAMGEAAAANLKAILKAYGCENVAQLNRNAYKYTDCGASVGVCLDGGEDNPGRWVYGGALAELKDEFIVALSVSSIVEGVEATTETQVIDLFDEAFETPEMAAAAYGAALEAVEKEADEIWKQTHGCPTCAEHWGNLHPEGIAIEGDDGVTPVWADCPDCDGDGTVF